MYRPTVLIVVLVITLLIVAALACSGGTDNIVIGDLPQYVCPSATPRATDTQLPPDPPSYPAYFAVNLQSTYYQSIGPITLQLAMQNAGQVFARYSGARLNPPYVWEGTGGSFITIATSLLHFSTSQWWLFVPSDVYRVDFTLYAEEVPGFHNLIAHQSAIFATAQPPPCCAPPPVFPTTRPTRTPYPTPTPYVRTNDYFIGDIIYTSPQDSGLHLGFRVLDMHSMSSTTLDEENQPQSIHRWTIQISNVGDISYTVFPPAQMYASVIQLAGSSEAIGVWGPSLAAAEEAQLNLNDSPWDMQDLLPGETKTFTLAAYGPVGTLYKVSYVLDASQRNDATPNPTEVPGSNIVSWINAVNTVCSGDIQEP